jgi:flavin reductase (DIM6/NTAB) family NADH-FMN oxidoreductase RutF
MHETIIPGPETKRAYRAALGRYATGVTVVTAASDWGPVGITANSFASVSLDPPLVLWSPARASLRFAAFETAAHFAIHILASDQDATCNGFARDGAAFDNCDWDTDADGVPRILGCLARFSCERHAVYDGGDHAIVVGRVTRAQSRTDGAPLLFHDGGFGQFLRPDGP